MSNIESKKDIMKNFNKKVLGIVAGVILSPVVSASTAVLSDGPFLPTVGSTQFNPLMPSSSSAAGFGFSLDILDIELGLGYTNPLFIDPDVATGYTYALSGAGLAGGFSFTSVLIPTVSNFGDGLFDVLAFNPTTSLYDTVISDVGINTSVDLSSLGYAVTNFQIQGIETSAMLDPTNPAAFVTGLTFAGFPTGSVSLTQTPNVTFVSNVPAPEALLLLMSGLVIMGSRKKTSQHKAS